VDGKKLQFSNLDKVLYPATGFTKGDVVDYFLQIAPVLLPHLRNRALTLKRYPNGVDSQFFYEKRCPAHRPDWVSTAEIWSDTNDENINYCVVNDRPTLAWLGNLACLELHTMLSHADRPDTPTTMVFDFDPGAPADLLDCLEVGIRMKDVLSHLGLECFPKTSGGKGLHLWVPLNAPATFEQTKSFAHAAALILEKDDPNRVTSVMRKDLRVGKVLIDWSQNDAHKTTACAYTLRARQQPTVSTPVTWEEIGGTLKKRDVSRLTFTAPQVLDRVEQQGDLFAKVLKLKQKLPRLAQ
jgi:bifunctional non-homologous end joining protein LigD